MSDWINIEDADVGGGPDEMWECPTCHVIIPVDFRGVHTRAHARRQAVVDSAAQDSNRLAVDSRGSVDSVGQSSSQNGGAAAAVTAQSSGTQVFRPDRNAPDQSHADDFDDEPREPCILCRKPVRKSLYEWHVQSCGVERTVECCVCVDDVPLSEVFSINCPQSHFTCLDCAQRMCEIAAREGGKARCPGCPAAQPYLLPSTEVLAIFKGDRNNDVYKRYADFELRNATSGGNFFSCRTPGCPKTVLLDDEASIRPTCFRCDRCTGSQCTLCKSQPFHYGMGCHEAAATKAMWIAVLQELVANQRPDVGGDSNLVRDLRARMDRHADLLKDEVWKEEHCRCCAKCGRPIEKMAGCDILLCGQDAHGGNKQDGCGANNNWAQMQPYRRRVPPAPCGIGVKNKVLLATTLHRELCEMCHQPCRGPRFECVCCPMLTSSLCLECIPRYTETRHKEHFFRVVI